MLGALLIGALLLSDGGLRCARLLRSVGTSSTSCGFLSSFPAPGLVAVLGQGSKLSTFPIEMLTRLTRRARRLQ